MSRGSLYELQDDVITAHNAAYIDKQMADEGMDLIYTAIRLTNGYTRYLRTLT